jgi:ABC-type transporter Mla subunit MlaD
MKAMNSGDLKKTLGLVLGVAVVLLLFAGLFFSVEDNPFRKPFLTFSIRFDDVAGIRERSKVYFLGIPAGYVKSLDYAPGSRESQVKVDVVITRKLNIPSSVRAYLVPTLLGDASIALRLPGKDEEKGTGSDAQDQPLVEGAEILGIHSTKLEAVMPGFDEGLAKIENLGALAEQRLNSIGEVVDRGVGALNGLFMEKGPQGLTKIDRLIDSLQDIINGPEGQKDQSLRSQLETIVHNLRVSSESIRTLADVQGKQQGSVGEVLRVFEETAKRLGDDAEIAQKLIGKMGHTSEAVTQASEQVKNLATVATEAIAEFHSRPFHYLTTTRPPPFQGERKSKAAP